MSLRADNQWKQQSNSEWGDELAYEKANSSKPQTREYSAHSNAVAPKDACEGIVQEHDWVPEGSYWIRYLEHDLVENYQGYGNKLVIHFSIREGPFRGLVVRAFYNVIITENGFIARGGSRWVRELRQLFPEIAAEALDPLKRPRPLPVSLIRNETILAVIGDSGKRKNKRGEQKDRPYSVIRELVEIKESTSGS